MQGNYSTDDLLEHLMRAEEALLYSDREGGFRVARQVEEGLLCFRDTMTGPMAKQLYAKVFRAVGAGLHGQEQQAASWMVAAVQMDPNLSTVWKICLKGIRFGLSFGHCERSP